MTSQWFQARGVIERVRIAGTLVLDTPAHFGNGDAEGLTDIPLLRDPYAGKPLLTGASIAGALRNHMREYELGYRRPENGSTRAERLFGMLDTEGERKASVQSWLVVDDALGEEAGIELRDGVAIDAKTRTAEEKKKFDVELLAAGTTFNLGLEFLVTEKNRDLLGALALALQALEESKIGLGQRKRRGYGRCHVSEWQVRRFDVTTPAGLLGWLDDDAGGMVRGAHIVPLVNAPVEFKDARDLLTLEGTLQLASSLLIRSGLGLGSAADMVHLRSRRGANGNTREAPILSGTSLAGALRGRALRIANTVAPARAADLIDDMFGRPVRDDGDDDMPKGSRVLVGEAEILDPLQPERVVSRVKIDRFTGGAYPQALFSEQPVFGTGETRVKISIALSDPQPAEVGLLLLLLKDLWTGDLTLGGESSIGRGQMSGIDATLKYHGREWKFSQEGERLAISADARELQECVDALKEAK